MGIFGKWVTAITAIIFSAGLWLALTLKQEYKTTILIPFELRNIPSKLSLAKPTPNNIYLSVKGTGWDLLFLQLAQGVAYRVDASSLSGKYTFNTENNYFHYIRISQDLNLISISPKKITIILEDKISKKVPIILLSHIEYKNGFNKIGGALISPDSVELSGASSIINIITSWQTEFVTANNIKSDIKLNAKLSDTLSFSISKNINNVTASWRVESTADKFYENVPIAFEDFPNDYFIRTIPSSVNISVRGASEIIAKLTHKDINAVVNYRNIIFDTTGKVSPKIILPADVELLKLTPNNIQYFRRKNK